MLLLATTTLSADHLTRTTSHLVAAHHTIGNGARRLAHMGVSTMAAPRPVPTRHQGQCPWAGGEALRPINDAHPTVAGGAITSKGDTPLRNAGGGIQSTLVGDGGGREVYSHDDHIPDALCALIP